MDKLNQHRTRIRKNYKYSKGALEKGMICEMSYHRRSVKGKSKLELKKYIVIVLNPNFNGFMHAMSLDEVSSSQLNNLATTWGLQSIGKGQAVSLHGVLTGLRIPKLTMNESSGRFYSSKFSKLKGEVLDSYRTFNIKQVGGQLSVIDYEWDKQVFDQQFSELIAEKAEQAKIKAKELAVVKQSIKTAEGKRKIDANFNKKLDNKQAAKTKKATAATKQKPTNL